MKRNGGCKGRDGKGRRKLGRERKGEGGRVGKGGEGEGKWGKDSMAPISKFLKTPLSHASTFARRRMITRHILLCNSTLKLKQITKPKLRCHDSLSNS